MVVVFRQLSRMVAVVSVIAAAWISDFFSRLAAHPEIRGVIWFNHDKEADWRIQSSDASRISYAAVVANVRYA